MNAEVLLDDICSDVPVRVAAAFQDAHGRGDELTPRIIERFERVLAVSREPENESVPYIGFLFFLAAEFRAQAAHPLMVQLLRMPVDLVDRAIGDGMTEGISTALADTCGGSVDGLLGLIDDSAANPFFRGAGLNALAMLWKRGVLSREETLSQLLRVAALLNPELEDDAMVGNAVVETAVKMNAHEIRGSILCLYERGLAEVMNHEFEYTAKCLLPGATPAEEEASLNRTINDAWAEVKWRACFTNDADRKRSSLPPAEPMPSTPTSGSGGDEKYAPPTPFRAAQKIGRNEPCPCGSGKKHKKCCGG